MHSIGINCDDAAIDGHLDRLADDVERAWRAGYDGYEFSVTAANAIRAGRIVPDELERLQNVLARFPLRYTVHGPNALHLTGQSPFQRQVFLSCLELSAAIHAEVMVYHSAQIALEHADGETRPLPDERQLEQMWETETDALKDMAGAAERLGVVIAVENRDPHLWELAALHRHGKGDDALTTYHQGMRLDLLAQQIRTINSANVGICLDVGHAFLAAPYWSGTDYLEAIRQAAPWVKHVHIHDNFGRLDDRAESLSERLIFGEADNHVPPGWGRIPLANVVSILKQAGYAGWLVVELRARYLDRLDETLAAVRALANTPQ